MHIRSEDVAECSTPREFLAHPKVQQALRIWNAVRKKDASSGNGEFQEYTLDEVTKDFRLKEKFVLFVTTKLEARWSLPNAALVNNRARSVQFDLQQILWGKADESILDKPFDPRDRRED